jgi:hypothetical protein
MATASQRFLMSRLRQSPRCRFDHQCVREAFHLGTEFGSATLGDVVQVLEQRFGSAPIHVECRRRLVVQAAFDTGRFVALDRLRDRAGESLATLGFVPADRLRAHYEPEGPTEQVSRVGSKGNYPGFLS